MMFVWLLLVLGTEPPSAATAAGSFVTMARSGQWQEIRRVAERRAAQLPLRPEEALIAGHAARVSGDPAAARFFLAQAVDAPEVGAVARVELAALVVHDDPAAAFDLVSDLLSKAPSRQLREAAVEITVAAVRAGIDDDRRNALQRALPTVGRSTRRPLDAALAVSRDPVDRVALGRVLAASTADLDALVAAEVLAPLPGLGVVERWLLAQTFFRHALYDRAIPILDGLADVDHRQVPGNEVAFLRGRCAFRRDRLDQAADWYRRAVAATATGERRAELEVHLARTLELAGDMDGAVAAAQRALRLKTTDDRRLFLARLRLRRGEPDLALAGLARVRSRSSRARGELMVGLFELRAGDRAAARRRLTGIDRAPWRDPAAVLSAELAIEDAEPGVALAGLTAAAPGLGPFWAAEARTLTAAMAAETLEGWRRDEDAAMAELSPRTRRLALDRALALEPDPDRIEVLRARAAAELGLQGEPAEPPFPSGLAANLWDLGLEASAVKWDPSGLPRDSARATWWTARTELALGRPWLAIRAADAAWRQAASRCPARGLPESLRRALYPLPYRVELEQASSESGVPWSLLAAVARAESRWDPAVLSKVGARGLMQLMPSTAAAAGAVNGRPGVTPQELFDPEVSLELGGAELGRLLAVYEGNRAAAVAAYNAGQAQADLWLDQCGATCPEGRYLAHVSFSVTRSYTEEVLAAAAAYEELYQRGAGNGRISERNGSPRAPATPAPASARSRR